ncbi:MAG: hypothetical protein IH616_21305, partial [Gemmatimonadales bacterium]|nr:hypothetical protein [Gemmatimonadales bacterium]
MSTRANSLAERKQQVLARAELERLRIRMAGSEARALLAPTPSSPMRPVALRIVLATS